MSLVGETLSSWIFLGQDLYTDFHAICSDYLLFIHGQGCDTLNDNVFEAFSSESNFF